MVRQVSVPAGGSLKPSGSVSTGEGPVDRRLPVAPDCLAGGSAGPEGHQPKVHSPLLDSRNEVGLAFPARRRQ
eukprot:5133411-Alexandrium_andersonii.AAC.1